MTTVSSIRKFWFVVAALVASIAWASPVAAHAQLDTSSPAPSAVLESAPSEIRLDFNEPVVPVARSIEIYNQEGQRIVVGEALVSSDDPSVLIAGDVPGIPDGLYVVAWRAVSNDGHAIEGAYSFQIGASAPIVATSDLIANVLSGQDGPRGLSWLMGIAKFLGFLGLCLVLGCLAMLAGGSISSRRVITCVGIGWIFAAVSALVFFVAQGPYTIAGTWSDLFDTSLWSDVYATRLGKALVVRELLLLSLLVLIWSLRGQFARSLTSWWRSTTLLVGIGIVLTLSVSGHPSASALAGVAVFVDALHFSSVILWVGGLIVVAFGGVMRSAHADVVVRRFSRIATFAIPMTVLTGLWQTWHLVPAIGDITQTTWGKALLVKTCFVIAAVTLGGFARWLVQRGEGSSIHRIVVVEFLIATVVLGVTAGMLSQSPEVRAANAVFSTQLVEGDMIVGVAVTPGRVGNNEIHVTISTPSGTLSPVEGVTMRLTLPGSEVPTITAAITELGPNHFVGTLSILTPGTWTLEILIQPDPSSSTRVTTDVPVAS
jgi:copper transport protein